ncbi:hypothetical protein HQ590_02275 [bacterium]|nr:hypothetical protein [bacterium]
MTHHEAMKARLAAATPGPVCALSPDEVFRNRRAFLDAKFAFNAHAPTDMALLLEVVGMARRLREDETTGKATALDVRLQRMTLCERDRADLDAALAKLEQPDV